MLTVDQSTTWYMFLLCSYQAPFDRHDWVVDRCGIKQRYIIDFYSGKNSSDPTKSNISFYLDVRPSIDTWDGIKLRTSKFFGSFFNPSPSASPAKHQ